MTGAIGLTAETLAFRAVARDDLGHDREALPEQDGVSRHRGSAGLWGAGAGAGAVTSSRKK